MKDRKQPAVGSFEAEFQSRLSGIYQRGKAAGLSVSAICDLADVARATPDRWRARTPLTVALVDKMEAVVADAERHAGTAAAD